jgi:hypothetical protein
MLSNEDLNQMAELCVYTNTITPTRSDIRLLLDTIAVYKRALFLAVGNDEMRPDKNGWIEYWLEQAQNEIK